MFGNILKLGGYALLVREAADVLASSHYHREQEQHRREMGYSATGVLAGLVVGVGIGLLFAPRSGRETRNAIAESTSRQLDLLRSDITERARQTSNTLKEKACEGIGDESQLKDDTK